MTNRPVVTDEICTQFCQDFARKHQLGDINAINDRFYFGISGESLAEALNNDLGWSEEGGELEEDFVFDMDRITDDIEAYILEETKAWLAKNPVTALPVGTRITYKRHGKELASGVITEYYNDFVDARYIVLDDEDAKTNTETQKVFQFANHEDCTQV